MRTQHFMRDSLCQHKLIWSSARGVTQRSSTRESTRDPGAEKASPAKFCKECTHQHVFDCEVGVLPAVPLEDANMSPLTSRTYTLHAFALAPCACTYVKGSPQTPPFSRPPATHFISVCHQIHFPSCRLALLQAHSTEITSAFVVTAGDTVARWPSFSGASAGIARGVGNLVGRGGRKLFLAVVVAEHMEVAALLQTGKATTMHPWCFLWAPGPQRNTSVCFCQNLLPSVLTPVGPGILRRAWRLKLWVAS